MSSLGGPLAFGWIGLSGHGCIVGSVFGETALGSELA
jgi:hypothetical protein